MLDRGAMYHLKDIGYPQIDDPVARGNATMIQYAVRSWPIIQPLASRLWNAWTQAHNHLIWTPDHFSIAWWNDEPIVLRLDTERL